MTVEREPYKPTIEEVARLAREVTLRDGTHIPTLLVQGSLGSALCRYNRLPDTPIGRAQLLRRTGFDIAEGGEVGELQQVFFIVEGWMSFSKENGSFDLPPSKDPKRKEILFVDGLDVDTHRSSMFVFEMIRDEDGELIAVDEFEEPGLGEDLHAKSPLLEAFADGFRAAMRSKAN